MQGNNDVKTISGKVMVTKNPCSHPGDLRLLTAIDFDKDDRLDGNPDEDEIKHYFENLINVIVFPSTGARPE
jgi:hypothetical protein